VRRTSVVVFGERSRYHAAPFSEVEATMSDIFNERAVALVDLFFAERDEELLANLRARAADVSNVAALREQTGISDDQVLADLVGLGVTSETLTAFSLVPMFAVAWTDGVLDIGERNAILVEAIASGIEDGSTAHKLIDGWLASAPKPELIVVWDEFAAALKSKLGATELTRLRVDVIDRALRVARASGGFLGIGAVSAAEARAVAWLERILT
jgi:hypothetical protein